MTNLLAHNDLDQRPRGGFSARDGGQTTFRSLMRLRLRSAAVKSTVSSTAPGMGLRQNDEGTAVDDHVGGQYWVINGLHQLRCCSTGGNAEIDSRDDDNGTMETTYCDFIAVVSRRISPGPGDDRPGK